MHKVFYQCFCSLFITTQGKFTFQKLEIDAKCNRPANLQLIFSSTFKKRHLKLSTPTHNYKFQRDDKIGRVMETFWYHARLILCPGLITLIPIVSKAFRQLLIPIECQDNSTIPLPPPLSHPMIFYWNNIDFWHLKTSHSSDTVTKLDTWWKLNLVSLQS